MSGSRRRSAPSFVDRAQTTGPGQAAFSLTFQHLQFQSLDGTNLRDGSFVTTANQFVDESTPFDVDRLTLNMDASVVTLATSVGITDELEIAVAAPIVSLYVDGSRVNAYRGRAFTQATARAQSVGLADLTVRSKYRLAGDGASGVAAALDLRLPTGSEVNLLGAGTPSVKLSGIGSIERGGVSAHGNAGVSIGGLARELSYNGAVAVAASPRSHGRRRACSAAGSTVRVISCPSPDRIPRSPASRRSGWSRAPSRFDRSSWSPGFDGI